MNNRGNRYHISESLTKFEKSDIIIKLMTISLKKQRGEEYGSS